MNHRYPYPSLTATHHGLVILAQSATPTQPSQRPFHLPISEAAPRTRACLSVASLSLMLSQYVHSHSQLTGLRIRHLPRSTLARGIDRSAYSSTTWRHLCLGCPQDAPPLPTAFPSYPRLSVAFVRTPSYQRHSHEVPFFCRLHRLAVYNGRRGHCTSAVTFAHIRTQRIVYSFPSSII